MEQWNNVELTSITKKSYTLNHDYDDAEKLNQNQNKANNGETTSSTSSPSKNGNTTEESSSSDVVLQPGSDIKPKVRAEDVEPLVRRLYGITVSEQKELISYDDRNYLIKEDWWATAKQYNVIFDSMFT